MRLFHTCLLGAWLCCAGTFEARAQQSPVDATPSKISPPPQLQRQSPARPDTDVSQASIDLAIGKGIDILLKLQEPGEGGQGPDAEPCQWPYEGVYRVEGKIPVGYRVGGTAIAILAIAQSPRYATDEACRAAVSRGVGYLTRATADKDMATDSYDGGYDVRIWGDIEGLWCLCRLKRLSLLPKAHEQAADAAIEFYLRGVIALEMPTTGGWNYARPEGKGTIGSPACFVTSAAPSRALFEAVAAGYQVETKVIERGLAVLEKSRGSAGNFVYSGEASTRGSKSDATPGAIGRMTQGEATLELGGRGSMARVRGSVDAFIVHWEWLNKRRAKPGTHQPPYMVAPYYFMFAHHYAAQAIELLPTSERAEYRRRVNELLFSVAEDGSWNDRVFPRSAGYGTAMALLALMQPHIQRPPWEAAKHANQP